MYFTPDVNKRFLRNNLILGQEGVYKKNNGEFRVMIYNLSDVEVDLPPRLREGFVRPQILEEGNEVNQLDHRAAEELTNEEITERREFIWTKLKLEENEILTNKEKEKVLLMFIKYWDAVSVGGHDLGDTHLGECKIKLQPDAVPTRSKLRPLNPDQLADLRRQIREWTEAGVIEQS